MEEDNVMQKKSYIVYLIHHRIGDGVCNLIFFPGFQLAIGKEGGFLYTRPMLLFSSGLLTT